MNPAEVVMVNGGETKVSIVCQQKPVAAAAIDASSTTTDDSDASTPKRETWARKIDFLLACIGFSVGLGNVWRFPYLCYKNGGGAFLIPYFICVILGGVPVFFLEVALGQFMSVGGIGAWAICPILQGIGFATTIIVFLLNCYYNVILTWAFYYLFQSFTSQLPWATCNNPWNTPHCYIRTRNIIGAVNETERNISSYVTSFGQSEPDMTNMTSHSASGFDPVTEFWERKVLQISNGIDDVGAIKWDLALCLLLAWVVVYLCIWKGIKTSGKVMYFTATSPYILMCILLIRGVTLPGAIEGIKFYVIPDWNKLADPQVWVDAGTQIFFSYSISLGTLTALGSYNKFNHNCWKDSIIFGFANSGTSFFAGFVIFSILGFMAQEQGVSVADVAESGPGLAFIAYPKAVAQMPVAPFWSILFFFMIILLGLDSQFVGVEGFVTAIVDQFPHQLRRGHRKELFIACVCVLSFLVGLPMTTHGGMYIFQLFDYYSGSRIILVVAFFECMAIGWLYGVNRFYDNLEVMLGYRLTPVIKVFWCFITPMFTVIMFGMCIYSYSELTYNRTYKYPRWAIVFGWMLACSSVIFIPGVAIWQFCRASGTFKERMQYLTTPKLKPHQLAHPDVIANKCSTLNPNVDATLTKVSSDSAPEKVPLTNDDTGVGIGTDKQSKGSTALPTEETRMLNPEDIRSQYEDDYINGVKADESNRNATSNDTNNEKNGAAFV